MAKKKELREPEKIIHDDMREVKYECVQCKAKDTARFFPTEIVLPIINCWKCHSGYSLPSAQQLQQRKGMVPVAA